MKIYSSLRVKTSVYLLIKKIWNVSWQIRREQLTSTIPLERLPGNHQRTQRTLRVEMLPDALLYYPLIFDIVINRGVSLRQRCQLPPKKIVGN
jgi:hypothetical protein